MEVSEKASRRSMIRSFFASVAAAGAGMFGVAHAQTKPVEMVKRTSTDGQAGGRQAADVLELGDVWEPRVHRRKGRAHPG